MGGAEYGVFQGGQPGQVNVFHDLAEHGRVIPGQPRVGVGERPLHELHPGRLPCRQPVKAEPPGRLVQRPH